jgi:peptidoglycan/xylan/chitin deacetylase (PgdA/CDA1 family)
MKQQLLNFMHAAGLFAPFRFVNRSKALIVTYHRFTRSDNDVRTAAASFGRHLDYLAQYYEIVPLSFIARRLAAGRGLPANIAAITIDDGYSDAHEIAFPILRERGLPAAMFVVTEFVDQKKWLWTDKLRYLVARAEAHTIEGNLLGRDFCVEFEPDDSIFCAADRVNSLLKVIPDKDKDEAIARIASAFGVEMPDTPPAEYRSVSWQQIREMSDSGIEIGSHTATHPILPNVSSDRLRRELRESRLRIEAETGRKVEMFCYPNGNYDRTVVREVAAAGYSCAVTVRYGLNSERSDPLTLKRIHAEYDLPHFIQSTSGFEEFKTGLLRLRGKSATVAAHRQYELG